MPIQFLPDEEAEPTGDRGDLATTARSFIDAVDAGRVTQVETFHRWASEIRRALEQEPSPDMPRARWSRQGA